MNGGHCSATVLLIPGLREPARPVTVEEHPAEYDEDEQANERPASAHGGDPVCQASTEGDIRDLALVGSPLVVARDDAVLGRWRFALIMIARAWVAASIESASLRKISARHRTGGWPVPPA